MSVSLQCEYLGTVSYQQALRMMEENLQASVQQKIIRFWALEHPLVYTSGLTFQPAHRLKESVEVLPVRRGGSVTLHNPGQLVLYTAAPLSEIPGGLDGFIRLLESAIIEILWQYQIPAFLFPPHSGVWTERGKIAFMGVGLKKGAIYHGAAINLKNNLSDYDPIISCGLPHPVTRLSDFPVRNWARHPDLIREFSERLFSSLKSRFSEFDPVAEAADFRRSILIGQAVHPFSDLAFRSGQLYFNERRYWHSHEAWEMFWKVSRGEFRSFLQGLIQLSMCLYKIHIRPNPEGARSLFIKAEAHLSGNRHVELYLRNAVEFRNYLGDLKAILTDFTGPDSKKPQPFLLQGLRDPIFRSPEKLAGFPESADNPV